MRSYADRSRTSNTGELPPGKPEKYLALSGGGKYGAYTVGVQACRVARPKAACQSSGCSESTQTSAMRVWPETRLNMQWPRTRWPWRSTKPENALPGQESM